MPGAAAMLAEARRSLGLGEPNHIQAWFRERNGAAYSGNFAWCDAAVTYWSVRSGNHAAVCPAGDRAYTVAHAEDFRKIGRWYAGTVENLNNAKPGDVVFFDWGETNSIGAIDHVGVIEQVLGGGRVVCIEGNSGDRCVRRVRSASSIAGFGRPAYGADKPYKWSGNAPAATLRAGDSGDQVRDLQYALLKAGRRLSQYGADGDYGDETTTAVKTFQRSAGVPTSGVYDEATAKALQTALTPDTEDEEEMRYFGQLTNGAAAVTAISLHPGDCRNGIGFWGDNGVQKLPPAKLRVAVHDKGGWYLAEVVVDATKPKPWIRFREPKTTDGASVQRLDDGAAAVAWDAS
ncbi:peptidoglycan-binding protein [Spirillospora sp. NPDC048911]|uniref:peptidoglycan-binding protein n=1 Tax=Spirillospora sp. NPDC048911 TaxID=3364527 RepID=UPI00371113B4